jgi:hypothetical protein
MRIRNYRNCHTHAYAINARGAPPLFPRCLLALAIVPLSASVSTTAFTVGFAQVHMRSEHIRSDRHLCTC